MNNINASIFHNQTIKNHTSKKFNLMNSKNHNNSNQNMFLSPSLNSAKNKNNKKNINYRYKSIDINTNINKKTQKKNFFLTPRYDLTRVSKNKMKESNKNSYNSSIDNNERCFILNNNLLEYNSIIALLSKILVKSNSYTILTKIKNFIKKLTNEKNDTMTLNNSSYKEYLSKNQSRPFSANVNMNKSEKIENNKEEEKSNINKSKGKSKNNELEKIVLQRKIKKLYQRINELEEKCRIEQLKYLFYIIDQEKKIVELENCFDNNQLPLDERIIEKMKELKCLPNYYKPDINEENIKIKTKRPPLSGKIKSSRRFNNNNSFLKSRNNNNNNIKNKYSFDKEIDPIIKRNQSQILNIRKNNKKDNYDNISKSKSRSKNMNFDESNELYEIKKQNSSYYYSKSVNQLFNEKNFFISHPKLKYVKDSKENNHFQRLKTKEQLKGISKLLSNINFGSKFQKIAVNDFSYFLNNSMVNVEKLRECHNYINIGNKFEENLKLKRKSSL